MQKAGESTHVFMCECKVKLELYHIYRLDDSKKFLKRGIGIEGEKIMETR